MIYEYRIKTLTEQLCDITELVREAVRASGVPGLLPPHHRGYHH